MKDIIQTSKGTVEFRIEGPETGPAILILNGGHTNCDSLVANLPLLLELGYRAIIPSRPGYGRTPLSTGRTTEEAADAMVSLLDDLGIKKTSVMAISAGERTAAFAVVNGVMIFGQIGHYASRFTFYVAPLPGCYL